MECLLRKPRVPLSYLFIFSVAGLLVQPLTSVSAQIPAAIPTLMSDTTIAVQAPASPVNVGDEFNIPVTITTDIPTWGAQLQITYDPTLLEITSVDEGGFYKEWAEANGASGLSMPKPAADNTKGIIPTTAFFLVGAAPGTGPIGSGTLAMLHARALKNGTVELKLSEIEVISSGLIDGTTAKLGGVKTQNGIIAIGDNAVIQPTAVPSQAIETVTVATPDRMVTLTSPATSNYLPTPTPTAVPIGETGPVTLVPAAIPTLQPDPGIRIGFKPAAQVINSIGATFTIEVWIQADKPVRGLEANIIFDPKIMECSEVVEGDFFSDWVSHYPSSSSTLFFPSEIDNSVGKIADVGNFILTTNQSSGSNGPTGTGSIYRLTCKAKAAGVGKLTLEIVHIYGKSYAYRRDDLQTKLGFILDPGEVTVKNAWSGTVPVMGLLALMLAFGLGYYLGVKNRPAPVNNTGSLDAGEKSTEVIDIIETNHQSTQGDNEIK